MAKYRIVQLSDLTYEVQKWAKCKVGRTFFEYWKTQEKFEKFADATAHLETLKINSKSPKVIIEEEF